MRKKYDAAAVRMKDNEAGLHFQPGVAGAKAGGVVVSKAGGGAGG